MRTRQARGGGARAPGMFLHSSIVRLPREAGRKALIEKSEIRRILGNVTAFALR